MKVVWWICLLLSLRVFSKENLNADISMPSDPQDYLQNEYAGGHSCSNCSAKTNSNTGKLETSDTFPVKDDVIMR